MKSALHKRKPFELSMYYFLKITFELHGRCKVCKPLNSSPNLIPTSVIFEEPIKSNVSSPELRTLHITKNKSNH